MCLCMSLYLITIECRHRRRHRPYGSEKSTWSKYVWINWLQIALGTHFNNVKKMQIWNNNHFLWMCVRIFVERMIQTQQLFQMCLFSVVSQRHTVKCLYLFCDAVNQSDKQYGNRLLTFEVWFYFRLIRLTVCKWQRLTSNTCVHKCSALMRLQQQ